ncbi:rCG62905 [Rattus norvegicus]|uniref:RCG62905 n=1 Tax=Rattus norvegicus TaxID=10116 RepID=A6KJ78_RAT|nr:rCG62905 [Rattus norvegicus]
MVCRCHPVPDTCGRQNESCRLRARQFFLAWVFGSLKPTSLQKRKKNFFNL